jgi:SAM-dependent methyltransferase
MIDTRDLHPGAGLYDVPDLYDLLVRRGPCEPFYRAMATEVGGDVLELGCGTGRLSIPIAAAGHPLVALDQAPSMLAAARAKAGAAGVRVSFVEGDMRGFDLGRVVALVVCTCNSLAHLLAREDLVACFRSVRRHLGRGGLFAFDVVNPNLALLARPAGDEVEIHRDARVEVREAASYDPVAQVRTARFRVVTGAGEVHLAPFVQRQIFPQELPLLLEAAGMRLRARWGSFERGPFLGDSGNQICLASPHEMSTDGSA